MSIDWEYLFTGKPSARQKTPHLLKLPLSMKLTNFTFRLVPKICAGLIAIIFRIVATVVRAIARIVQRDRNW